MAEDLEPADVEVLELDFDDKNLEHLAPHGLTRDRVEAIWQDQPAFLTNRPGRSGSHMMVGIDAAGRMWTIVIGPSGKGTGWWRPITGWPSVRKEARRWLERWG